MLADYKTDKEAKLERPEKFAIIDTVAKKRTVYSLPQGVSYTFPVIRAWASGGGAAANYRR